MISSIFLVELIRFRRWMGMALNVCDIRGNLIDACLIVYVIIGGF